jgi:hypothetical protein
MFNLKLEQFKRPIQDAVRWCAQLAMMSQDRDSPPVSHRRTLLAEANRLWDEARQVAKSGWVKRNIRDTVEWQAAQKLLVEAIDSSKPIVSELRNSRLMPSLPADQYKSESDWAIAVDEVILKRSGMLTQGWTEQVSEYSKGGRLLLYFPEENLACGAAQVSSGGFYDLDNVPPWDIWVGFSGGALLSWAPPALIEIAQMGIDVNPETCIRWAEQ